MQKYFIFYASPNEIMPVKTGRPAIFRITVTFFNPQKCCSHFYPLSALISISLFPIKSFMRSELRNPPPPTPWKIFFIRACYALCIKAGRNYDKRTNRRTFDPINRSPGGPFRPGLNSGIAVI